PGIYIESHIRCLCLGRVARKDSEAAARIRELPANDPHQPPRHEYAADEHREAVKAVADLFLSRIALSDAEDYGCKHREQERGAEMGEFESHAFFPMAI